MSSGQTSLEQMLGVYKWVVDDVIKNVREDFLNEGVDTQILEDLKQLWENKLVQSGALSRPVKAVDLPPQRDQKQNNNKQTVSPHSSTGGGNSSTVIQQAPPRLNISIPSSNPTPASQQNRTSTVPTVTTTATTVNATAATQPATSAAQTNNNPLLGMNQQQLAALVHNVQQQAALYSAMTAGATGTALQPLVIPNAAAIPAGGLSLIQHGGVPYAAVPTATGITYVPIASLNLAGQQQQQQPQDASIPQSDGSLPPRSKDKKKKKKKIKKRICHVLPQLDGAPGSSSEESDESSESEPEELEDEPLNDEEPLNSNDDAESDEEEDVWDTDNTIVCQFEKVYRVRSKWKFALKDGIMHLKGHDYIFTKTNGEADW